MKKLTVLIDMDDTIECLLDAWIDALNKKYGRNVDPQEVNDWDVLKFYPGLSNNNLYSVFREEDFWDKVVPKGEAVEYVRKIMDDGHDVLIVTSSYYDDIGRKMRKVLFKWFPYIPWRNVIVASRKQMIRGDVLIDDGVHNLVGGAYAKILMEAPHNRAYDAEGNGMLRVKTWPEAYREVKNLAFEAEYTEVSRKSY